MKLSSFRYLLKEGLRNLWRNRIMSLTSIGVLTTCLLIVGAAFFADGKRQQHGSVCRGAERDVRLYGRRPFR